MSRRRAPHRRWRGRNGSWAMRRQAPTDPAGADFDAMERRPGGGGAGVIAGAAIAAAALLGGAGFVLIGDDAAAAIAAVVAQVWSDVWPVLRSVGWPGLVTLAAFVLVLALILTRGRGGKR